MALYFKGRPVGLEGPVETISALLSEVRRFTATLSPRELVVLKIGLEASHLEESIAHGDWTRAEAHAESLSKLISQR